MVSFTAPKRFFIAPLYQHEFSVAGDSTREDIHRGTLRIFGNVVLTRNWYLMPEFNMVIDYQNNNNVDAYFAPELGYTNAGTTIYLKPGIGFAPDAKDRAQGVEFGFRIAF